MSVEVPCHFNGFGTKIEGKEFGYVSDRRRKEGIIKERERGRGGEKEEQTNALIINLQLSSSVEACASGKPIDAGNNMKR